MFNVKDLRKTDYALLRRLERQIELEYNKSENNKLNIKSLNKDKNKSLKLDNKVFDINKYTRLSLLNNRRNKIK